MKTKIHTMTIAVTDGKYFEPEFSTAFPYDLATELEKTLAEHQKMKCAACECNSILEARIAELGQELESAHRTIEKYERMADMLKDNEITRTNDAG